jgi:hypothetical protein
MATPANPLPALTPAQQRRELLGDEAIEAIQQLAATAPALTSEQRDTIRQAFKGTGA